MSSRGDALTGTLSSVIKTGDGDQAYHLVWGTRTSNASRGWRGENSKVYPSDVPGIAGQGLKQRQGPRYPRLLRRVGDCRSTRGSRKRSLQARIIFVAQARMLPFAYTPKRHQGALARLGDLSGGGGEESKG